MASREHTLGIDEGTTGVRAAVLHASGRVAGEAYREIGQRFPQPGWVEHDPAEVWERTQEVVARALERARLAPADLAGIGITNQRGSAVLFDDASVGLGPIIGWQDQRTTARCEELLGQGVFVIPMAAGSKYEWLLAHHAGRVPGARLRLGTIDAWLAHLLSEGTVHATDHSNCSVSGVYDFAGGGYDKPVVAALGIEPAWLPRIVETSAVLGETSARVFGAKVPIASLSGDQHASMYALGCHQAGSVKLTLGTSGMLDRNAGPQLVGSPVGAYPLILWCLDGVRTYCFEGAVITAGAAAQWLRDGLGIVTDLRELEPLARSVPSSEGVWAVPSLQGLGTPHLDVTVRGLIGGVSRGTTRAHVARAILEGIAWRTAEALGGLRADCTEPLATLRVDGGAAANALLLELIADATGAVVERPEALDSSVLGAAFFAGRAVGVWRDADVVAAWRSGGRFAPRMGGDERAALRERWQHRVKLVCEAGR